MEAIYRRTFMCPKCGDTITLDTKSKFEITVGYGPQNRFGNTFAVSNNIDVLCNSCKVKAFEVDEFGSYIIDKLFDYGMHVIDYCKGEFRPIMNISNSNISNTNIYIPPYIEIDIGDDDDDYGYGKYINKSLEIMSGHEFAKFVKIIKYSTTSTTVLRIGLTIESYDTLKNDPSAPTNEEINIRIDRYQSFIKYLISMFTGMADKSKENK